jgi:hypothetical protein
VNEPKFKIGETVVITEVSNLANSIYIGKLGKVYQYYKDFKESGCDYQVELYNGKNKVWCHSNVREATEMDKALEGL